jgi:hypothetical protein
MQTKRKLSLTIDRDVYQAIEEAAAEGNRKKSHIAQQAFELWLRKETEAKMAEGYEEMQEENKAFAELTFEAQRETL